MLLRNKIVLFAWIAVIITIVSACRNDEAMQTDTTAENAEVEAVNEAEEVNEDTAIEVAESEPLVAVQAEPLGESVDDEPAPADEAHEADEADAAPDGPPLAPLRDDIVRAGVTVNEDGVQSGYNLYSPIFNTETYLMNTDGEIVHTWASDYFPGSGIYMLEDGSLLRAGTIAESEVFAQALREGGGGIIQQIDWDGNVVWEFDLADDRQIQHHDIELLPNGNILALVYVYLSPEEAIEIGRNPDLIPEEGAIWSENVVEIDPTTNEIVWEWRVVDHLIQKANAGMPNYGEPSEHPELIDFNYYSGPMRVDWIHMNAIDYNADLEQIVLSAREFSEVWIIDHSTTTEEAASHEGGRYGRGGDLLFRWGNPAAYDMGEKEDQVLYLQHDTQWIADGLPGAGNLLMFDNGSDERPHSEILEIAPVQSEPGVYVNNEAEIVWRYPEQPREDFYSFIMGGVQRQPNGNTLIMESFFAHTLEVTPTGEIVWEWYEPNRMWVFRMERYLNDSAPLAGRELE